MASIGDAMTWLSRDRYYHMRVERDLFGNDVLMAYWGGRQNRLGGRKALAIGDESIALEMTRVAEVRAQHGYRLSDGHTNHFQQPSSDVAVKANCITNKPDNPLPTANVIQNTFDIKKKRNPSPDARLFRARKSAPSMPNPLPIHSIQFSKSAVKSQLPLSF